MAFVLWIIAILLVFSPGLVFSRECPCVDVSLCKTISRPPGKEFYMWSVDPWIWKQYDWTKITTIGIFRAWNKETDELLCFARSKGVRVVLAVDFSLETLHSSDARERWVKNTTTNALENFVDGINIDFEKPIAKGSEDVELLTELVHMVATSLRQNIPGSQVTFDVPFSPDCMYGRCYDYKALADILDFLVIMAYDEPAKNPCLAHANSPYDQTTIGVEDFLLKHQISADKLVLALPWYGYDFTCQTVDRRKNVCLMNCSHFVDRQIGYWEVQDLLLSRTDSGRQWNKIAMSPLFFYNDEYGVTHQVWYDDPESLALKYIYASNTKLRGVGIWNPDLVDYGELKRTSEQTKAMWDALSN